MSAKSTIRLTFFQNLQKKGSSGPHSTNFDADLTVITVKILKKMFFCHRTQLPVNCMKVAQNAWYMICKIAFHHRSFTTRICPLYQVIKRSWL